MDHQQQQRQQRSPRGNASGPGSGSGSGGSSTSSGKHKGDGKKSIKVVYISNPMRVKTSAAGFRALVQELTGRHADPSKYSPEDLDGAGAGADTAADLDGAAQGLSPGGAAASSDTVLVSPIAAADYQLDAAATAPHAEYYDEEDEDGFRSQLLENSYSVFSPPTLLYDHHPHSKQV